MKPEFSRQFFFSKNTEILNFMKIHPVGVELFHADGETNRYDEAFCNFAKTPKKDKLRKELITADIFGRRLLTVGYWALNFVQKLM